MLAMAQPKAVMPVCLGHGLRLSTVLGGQTSLRHRDGSQWCLAAQRAIKCTGHLCFVEQARFVHGRHDPASSNLNSGAKTRIGLQVSSSLSPATGARSAYVFLNRAETTEIARSSPHRYACSKTVRVDRCLFGTIRPHMGSGGDCSTSGSHYSTLGVSLLVRVTGDSI